MIQISDTASLLFMLGIAMFLGYLMTRVLKPFRLPAVTSYLIAGLLPQAGVALGMSVTVGEDLGAEGAIIRNIVLFSVLIYELFGPMLTKIALTKAGEITPKPEGQDRSRFAPAK